MPKDRNFGRPPRAYFHREVGSREQEIRFLIVCEGAKTEPKYFMRFRVSGKVEPIVRGLGFNTVSLVKRAIELQEADEYNQVWCVLDRDSFARQDFNSALDLAHRNDIKVAYSNQAFELWYLLHFNYYDTALSRHQYKRKLTECLGHKYAKNSDSMYDELISREPDAIRNAEQLLAVYQPINPVENNPSTTVHILVQELRKHSR